MAKSTLLLVAVIAVIGVASASIYDDNVRAFSRAINGNPNYSVFAKYYVQYVNNSQVRSSMQHPALIFIPSNKAIKANKHLESLKMTDMTRYVSFHAVLFANNRKPLGAAALTKLKAGMTLKTQEGGVITKVSAPGKNPVRLRGKKPTVVKVVDPNLFSSATLIAMGVDGIMTPSNM